MYNCTSEVNTTDTTSTNNTTSTINGGSVMKKKLIIIISVVVAVLVLAVASNEFIGSMILGETAGNGVAFVTKISDINGLDIAFSSNRYNGVVEMEEIVSLKIDEDKLVKETFVKEGDTVKKGDKLFEYDVDQLNLQLSQAQLDLDQANASITQCNNQISQLERDKSGADQNELLNIQNQILSLQLEIKSSQYTVNDKQSQIDKLNEAIKNNVVKADVDGKILKINKDALDELAYGEVYITMATTEDYRIKSTISEQNIDKFSKDAPIIIRSRLDESQTWTGKVQTIDTSAPVDNSASIFGGEDSDTKYPVYISIDNAEGLMVGQHITIEIDNEAVSKTLDWGIDKSYICDVDTKPYVWCKGSNAMLEKRYVELGKFDEESNSYAINSGLTPEDSIAFPEEHLVEGMFTLNPDEDLANSEEVAGVM